MNNTPVNPGDPGPQDVVVRKKDFDRVLSSLIASRPTTKAEISADISSSEEPRSPTPILEKK